MIAARIVTRYTYFAPPADGIWDMDLMATAPTGPVAQVISKTGPAFLSQYFPPRWCKGVRVHASSGQMETMFPPPKFKVPDLVAVPIDFHLPSPLGDHGRPNVNADPSDGWPWHADSHVAQEPLQQLREGSITKGARIKVDGRRLPPNRLMQRRPDHGTVRTPTHRRPPPALRCRGHQHPRHCIEAPPASIPGRSRSPPQCLIAVLRKSPHRPATIGE